MKAARTFSGTGPKKARGVRCHGLREIEPAELVTVAAAITAPAPAAATITSAITTVATATVTAPAAAAAATTSTVAAISTAATATATESAATTAAAAAAESTATAAATGTFFTGTGDVHGQGTAAEIFAMEQFHRLVGFFSRCKLNKREAAGLSSHAIQHQVDVGHHTCGGKVILEITFQRLVGQVPDEQTGVFHTMFGPLFNRVRETALADFNWGAPTERPATNRQRDADTSCSKRTPQKATVQTQGQIQKKRPSAIRTWLNPFTLM